jgi:hypothetical protein
MPKKRGTDNTQKVFAENKAADAAFILAFATIDAAETGALLAGLHPYAMEPALSFWFLQTAAAARDHSRDIIVEWMNRDIITSLMQKISLFVDAYEGEAFDQGEADELNELQAWCTKGNFHRLPELDQKRYNDQASKAMEWVMINLAGDEALTMSLCEMALLLEYLKVCAIARDIHPDVYLTVRKVIRPTHDCYDDLLR